MPEPLGRSRIYRVVNDYIGVQAGYLGDFSYRTHAEFYPYYCELDIDTSRYSGTTRERFLQILEQVPPADQARILRGLLQKYKSARTPQRIAMEPEIQAWIEELERDSTVASPSLTISSAVVERALRDAEALIRGTGATSGVDRIHTALHGYLKTVCDRAGISYGDDPKVTELFKALRERHPRLAPSGPRAQDITTILRQLASIMDALNPLRNKASVAHPNAELLGQDEAMLVVNTVRSILHYLESKLGQEP